MSLIFQTELRITHLILKIILNNLSNSFSISFLSCFSQIADDHSRNGRSEKRISTTSKPHSDLVKWQGTPIRTPLLRLPPDLSPLALECFDCILRYCGDLPPDPELTEVKCVYTVLMVCVFKLKPSFLNATHHFTLTICSTVTNI